MIRNINNQPEGAVDIVPRSFEVSSSYYELDFDDSKFMSEGACGAVVEEYDDCVSRDLERELIIHGDLETILEVDEEEENKILLGLDLQLDNWADSESWHTQPSTPKNDDDVWITVGSDSIEVKEKDGRSNKWCKHQNACVWANCPFRHERCEHHDRWVATRGRTRGCRSHVTDPDSCKSPEQGGCQYDHRDLSKLRILHETLPCSNEDELICSFGDLGLDYLPGSMYDISTMAPYDKRLLLRSLNAVKDLKHDLTEECNDTYVTIYF